jgi:hypothetical protein
MNNNGTPQGWLIERCASGHWVVVRAGMAWCYLPCAERRYTSTYEQALYLVALYTLAAVTA